MKIATRTIPVEIVISRKGKDLVFTKIYDLNIQGEVEHVETVFLTTPVPRKGDTITLPDLLAPFTLNEVY